MYFTIYTIEEDTVCVKKRERMDENQARNYLRNIAKTGYILASQHCRRRMNERNVSTEDILHVLMWGETEELKYDDQHQNYKCQVKGDDLDGDVLILNVAVSEKNNSVFCITVY